MKKINSLFHKKWYTNISLNAIGKNFNNVYNEEYKSLEKRFIANFFQYLIDNEDYYPDLVHFMNYALGNKHRSKSQILQDLWVLFMSGEKQNGYFVEFGACDGLSLSNTLLLEQEYGWKGILAEPNPFWIDDLKKNRTNAYISTKCVYSQSDKNIEFIHTPTMAELSRINNIVPDDYHEKVGNRKEQVLYNVETISLYDLLQEANAPKEIDYLSIDTEGSELLVLENFDFSSYRFKYITIEHAGEEEKRKKIFELLTKNGYHRWYPEVSRWDDWYILVHHRNPCPQGKVRVQRFYHLNSG